MKKNKKYTLENIKILDFAAEGKCIVKNEGEVIFVDGSQVCPNDEVTILVSKSKKKYSEGRILKINSFSNDRVEPFCEHFGVCGGCKWQHVPYETQLAQKQKQVTDQLTRIGKIQLNGFENILGSEKIQYYRNKLEYTFSNSRWLTPDEIATGEEFDSNALGFHVPKRFDKVYPVKKCFLQPDPSNQIRDFFNDFARASGLPFYDHVAHEGFFRSLMIRTTSIGESMVVVQFAKNDPENIEKTLNSFLQKFPNTTSLNYFVNTKRNDSYFDLEPINFFGKPYITEKMEDLDFRIGVKSFYQTNSDQAYNLYKLVREYAQIEPNDTVYDLYTGTGTIALFVSALARKVVGIEYIEAAVEDARINAEVNEVSNSVFFAGDMAKIFTEEFINENGKPDIVIADPPRAGMDKPVIETLLKIAPRRIVYVSCNPATQARDLELLSVKYETESLRPVDMFPHTFHVENVVSLILKN
ncbi:MAG: 23S rRNA (uracil(1939)-C(5))-methyltransferase RlmD [Bacteroidetes bacterium]|nr:23S rRNA (uracil(1939)-C(5))-methyltransferase RlmD [Bacteroidota bacterium]